MTEEEKRAADEAAHANANLIKRQEMTEAAPRENVYSEKQDDDPKQEAPPPLPI